MSQVSFTLNGTPVRIDVRDDESLLETLRTRCGVKSAKDGCAPQGQCGACVILVDGTPRTSCATKVEAVEGKSIT
ncbi:MAG TPA: 2Fe-2S iron-sulfur cluster-binding protein, partial [Thermoanaerobaculia bacterium]|nr:2Fe-2S iron-sulfur cluster-binding protein [Thermoanaerobaculia bacterium]